MIYRVRRMDKTQGGERIRGRMIEMREEWESRKWVLSAKAELIESKTLTSWIDFCLLLPWFVFFSTSVYTFFSSLTPPSTHSQPGSCFIKNLLCYWLPKLPLNFHLAIRLVCAPQHPRARSHSRSVACEADQWHTDQPRRSGCSLCLFHSWLLFVFFIKIGNKLSWTRFSPQRDIYKYSLWWSLVHYPYVCSCTLLT